MLNAFDAALFPILNRGAANPLLDWLMPRLTNLHQQKWFILLLFALLLYIGFRGSRRSKVWALSLMLAIGLSDLSAARVVKYLANRDRPCKAVAGSFMAYQDTRLVPGEHCPGSNSFPSNHAANMMALATVCWWFTSKPKPRTNNLTNSVPTKNWKPLLWFLIPIIVGYSRIYLGYHYPTDVLVGYLLGGCIAGLTLGTCSRLLTEPNQTNETSPEPELV